MKRVNEIYDHPVFQEKFRALQEAEKDRLFCKHTLEHLIDVARLMYLFALEQELVVSKEVIYALALMHDIGRLDQIEKGIPHEQAGADLCDVILPDCGFTKAETDMIKAAILQHRNQNRNHNRNQEKSAAADENNLYQELLYRADKKSRNCFACEMQNECNWEKENMNLEIQY